MERVYKSHVFQPTWQAWAATKFGKIQEFITQRGPGKRRAAEKILIRFFSLSLSSMIVRVGKENCGPTFVFKQVIISSLTWYLRFSTRVSELASGVIFFSAAVNLHAVWKAEGGNENYFGFQTPPINDDHFFFVRNRGMLLGHAEDRNHSCLSLFHE